MSFFQLLSMRRERLQQQGAAQKRRSTQRFFCVLRLFCAASSDSKFKISHIFRTTQVVFSTSSRPFCCFIVTTSYTSVRTPRLRKKTGVGRFRVSCLICPKKHHNRERKARLCVCVCSCHLPTSCVICVCSLQPG